MITNSLPEVTPVARRGISPLHFVFICFVLTIQIESISLISLDSNNLLTISKFAGYILFFFAIINWKKCFRAFTASGWMILWYVLFLAMSLAWIPNNAYDGALSIISNAGQTFVLFIIAINIFEDSIFRERLFRIYAWWTVLISIGVIWGNIGQDFSDSGRISLTGADPNDFAALLAAGLVSLLSDRRIFSGHHILPKLFLHIIGMTIVFTAILKTGSRGSLIAVFAGSAATIVAAYHNKNILKKILLTATAIGILSTLTFQEFATDSLMAERISNSIAYGDTAHRTYIWESAWLMVKNKPFIGYGPYNNLMELGTYCNMELRETHNMILAVLTSSGIIGGLPFLLAFFYAIWKSWKYARWSGNSVYFATIISLCIANMSINSYRNKMFWIIFAAAVACGLEYDKWKKQQT